MFQDVVELGERIDVSGHTTIDFLGVMIVSKVCMVNKDLHRYGSASEQMPPMEKAVDEAHEFSIPDVIILFSFCKGL